MLNQSEIIGFCWDYLSENESAMLELRDSKSERMTEDAKERGFISSIISKFPKKARENIADNLSEIEWAAEHMGFIEGFRFACALKRAANNGFIFDDENRL